MLAILIACLGLFGLTTVAVEKRVKEVGIRKVLGASISSIASTLSKELLFLVVIANCFAWPLAYFASQLWLQDFAYRIDVSIWYFLLSSLLATGIALLTISSTTIKAALTNPVESLRTE